MPKGVYKRKPRGPVMTEGGESREGGFGNPVKYLSVTPANSSTCSSCAWYERLETDQNWGRCHYLPTLVRVEQKHWCGQHRSRS